MLFFTYIFVADSLNPCLQHLALATTPTRSHLNVRNVWRDVLALGHGDGTTNRVLSMRICSLCAECVVEHAAKVSALKRVTRSVKSPHNCRGVASMIRKKLQQTAWLELCGSGWTSGVRVAVIQSSGEERGNK